MSVTSDTILSFADRLRAGQDSQQEVRKTYEKWVVFRVSTRTLALPVTHVREILRLETLTGVPNAPKPVAGVVNLRGHVLPVVDTHSLLGLPPSMASDSTRVLVFLLDGRAVGLIVDEARSLEKLEIGLVRAVPETEPLAGFCRGELPCRGAESITLLEPAALFAEPGPASN